jgi:hypothetical protein
MKYIDAFLLTLFLALLLFISFKLYYVDCSFEHFNNNDFYKWKEVTEMQCNSLKNDINKINKLLKSCNINNKNKIRENINDNRTCLDATNMSIYNDVERSAWCKSDIANNLSFDIQSNIINNKNNQILIPDIFKSNSDITDYKPYRIINDYLFTSEKYN